MTLYHRALFQWRINGIQKKKEKKHIVGLIVVPFDENIVISVVPVLFDYPSADYQTCSVDTAA